jgi:hypothetical protein
VVGSCEYGDEPSGSGATELVIVASVSKSHFLRMARTAAHRQRAECRADCELGDGWQLY